MIKTKSNSSFIFILLQILIAISIMLLIKDIPSRIGFFILNLLFYVIVFIIPIIYYIIVKLKEKPLTYLNIFDKNSINGVVVGLIISVSIIFIFFAKNLFLLDYKMIDPLIFTGTALAGIFEEIPFRGFYLKIFKNRFGFFKANVYTSFLFTIMHFSRVLSGDYI